MLSALSDYRVEFEEPFRFQELIASLQLPEVTDDGVTVGEFGYSNDEEGVWEARTASMALINALTNCPAALEERILLREEFGRRGLNEVIVVCSLAFRFMGLAYQGPRRRYATSNRQNI